MANNNFRIDTKYDVNLIDWAKNQHEINEKENEKLREQLFGGLKNIGKSGAYAKMYQKQQDEYDSNMNEIYNTSDSSKQSELMSKYGINPEDYKKFAHDKDIENSYNKKMEERKKVIEYLNTPKDKNNSYENEDDIQLGLVYSGYYG